MAVSVLLFSRNFFINQVFMINSPCLSSFDDIDAIRNFTCKAKG
jgi:hypothetical protein